jgi:hypothetical protein
MLEVCKCGNVQPFLLQRSPLSTRASIQASILCAVLSTKAIYHSVASDRASKPTEVRYTVAIPSASLASFGRRRLLMTKNQVMNIERQHSTSTINEIQQVFTPKIAAKRRFLRQKRTARTHAISSNCSTYRNFLAS